MAGVCVLLALGGRAQAEPAPLRHAGLSVSAEAACATASALAARVRATGWELDLGSQPGAELTLSAALESAGDGVRARLEVHWPDGRAAVRELAAGSCSAALDALALLIGMTLDSPEASRRAGGSATRARTASGAQRRAERAAASRLDEPAASGEGVAAVSGEPLAAVGAEAVATTSAGQAAPDGARSAAASGDAIAGPAPAAPGTEPSWLAIVHGAIGALGVLGSGAAPQLEPGLGLYGALALQGRGWLRPLLQLELAHAWQRDVRAQGGRADFSWDGGQLSVCPLGLRHGGLAGHACAALELARLRASGYDAYQPRSVSRPWASTGLALRGTLAVSRLELQLGASLLHPLWRDRFAFAQDVFHTVPAWRFQLLLGLGIRFP